jgi:hypothetical protein
LNTISLLHDSFETDWETVRLLAFYDKDEERAVPVFLFSFSM